MSVFIPFHNRSSQQSLNDEPNEDFYLKNIAETETDAFNYFPDEFGIFFAHFSLILDIC